MIPSIIKRIMMTTFIASSSVSGNDDDNGDDYDDINVGENYEGGDAKGDDVNDNDDDMTIIAMI